MKNENFRATTWCTVALFLVVSAVRGQELEPRSYINVPVGMNFLLVGGAYQDGDMLVDPSLLVEDARTYIRSFAVGYLRSFDLFGRGAKIAFAGAYSDFSAKGLVDGEPRARETSGFSDPGAKITVNLLGGPALKLDEFKDYDREQFILGLGFAVSMPLGGYDSEYLLNVGFNRWAFKPELGFSKMWGRWILEGSVARALFTDNNDFFGGVTRKQEPLSSIQAHVIYRIRPGGFWVAFDATHFWGGQTTVDGIERDDALNNNRFGFTLAVPVSRKQSLKLYASDGVNSRRGSEYKLLGLAWQYRWGGGL